MPDLLYEKRDGVAIITFNRPEQRNALSPADRFGIEGDSSGLNVRLLLMLE